jgi:hypothetical protein
VPSSFLSLSSDSENSKRNRRFFYFDAKKVGFFWFETETVTRSDKKNSFRKQNKNSKRKQGIFLFAWKHNNFVVKAKQKIRCKKERKNGKNGSLFRLSTRIGSETDTISLLSDKIFELPKPLLYTQVQYHCTNEVLDVCFSCDVMIMDNAPVCHETYVRPSVQMGY